MAALQMTVRPTQADYDAAELDRFSTPVASTAASPAPVADPLDEFSVPVAAQPQAATAEAVNPVADVAKAAGSGLVKGAAGIVGLPGDFQNIIGDLAGALGGVVGASPEQIAQARARASSPLGLGHAPTTEDVVSGIHNVTGFTPYEPQTGAGKVAGAVAEFVPGALVGGPAKKGVSMLANAGKNVLKYAVAPGAASEMAGQVADSVVPELAPAARFVGALAGGGLGAAHDVMAERGAAAKAIPSTEAIRDTGSALYKASEKEGVVLAPAPLSQAIKNIGAAVRAEGLDKDLTPKAFAAMNRLQELKGASPTLKEVDTVRKVLNIALKSDVPADTHMAHMMIDKLDSYLSAIRPGQVLSAGDPTVAVQMLKDARTNWATQSKSAILDGIMERAQNRAGQYSQSGLENAIRTEFRQLAMNPKRIGRFTLAEQQAIRFVAQGGKIENAMRMIGKFAPHGVVSAALGGGAGFMAGGPIGAAGAMVAGEAGRLAATKLTKDAAARASATVRNGGQLPAQLRSPLSTAVAKRTVRSSAIAIEGERPK